MDELRYPVGRFEWKGEVMQEQQRNDLIHQIEEAPAELRAAVQGLSDQQLDTPYRPGGWTVRQVVHHLSDSHANLYVRFRLALTEDEPTVKPFDQERWAQLADAKTAPVETSLQLVDSLHRRMTLLLRTLTLQDFKRVVKHPELGVVSIERYAGMCAWHGRHHVAHITSLRKRMGWS